MVRRETLATNAVLSAGRTLRNRRRGADTGRTGTLPQEIMTKRTGWDIYGTGRHVPRWWVCGGPRCLMMRRWPRGKPARTRVWSTFLDTPCSAQHVSWEALAGRSSDITICFSCSLKLRLLEVWCPSRYTSWELEKEPEAVTTRPRHGELNNRWPKIHAPRIGASSVSGNRPGKSLKYRVHTWAWRRSLAFGNVAGHLSETAIDKWWFVVLLMRLKLPRIPTWRPCVYFCYTGECMTGDIVFGSTS